MQKKTLDALGLADVNAGTYLGPDGWAKPGDDLIESVNPATTKPIAKVAATTVDEYEQLIGNAQETFVEWRAVPAPRRGEAIRLCADALRANKDALGTLVALEMGKIKAEGDGEVQEMIDIADFAVGLSRQLYGLTMHSERPGHRMYEQWHPLGLVGIISAFNFPVAVWAWNAFLAAVCGDVSIWKPSPRTPLCGIASLRICNKALEDGGFPPIFYLFNDAGTELAQRFVDDKRIPLISFTGSTKIGRHVGQSVAKRLGRSLLELGGNNALIVDESADLKLAIPAIAFGACGTAGQRCTSTRRLIVHSKIQDQVVATLEKAYGQVASRAGDPTDPATLLGPLNNEGSVAAFKHAVAEARKAGGKVVCGGEVMADRDGYFVQPTIITGLAPDADIVREETFAPILYVLPFDDIDEAIAIQNAVPQGLSSAIFTRDLQAAERFLAATGSDCGIANVNLGTSGAEIGGAFGGEKDTGGGRESGSDAWRVYMRRQTNTINYSKEMPLAQGIKFDF